MIGIHAAFTGRIGKDAEARSTRDGKPWASFPVAVDAKDGETPTIWVRVALFGDTVGTMAPRLTKGAEVYCEGRLSLGTWTGRDGEQKTGLNLAAQVVQPMGQVGRRAIDVVASARTVRAGTADKARPPQADLNDALPF